MNMLDIADYAVVELNHSEMLFIKGGDVLDAIKEVGKTVGYAVGYAAGAVKDVFAYMSVV